MTTCQGCGAETNRSTVVFDSHGYVREEWCTTCRPEAFERHTVPSDKKLWLGWEYDQAHYKRTYDKDGPIMMPSDSVLQDLEDAACKRPEEELRSEEAQRQKRLRQRTAPMTDDEMKVALDKARLIAGAIERHHASRV